MRKIIFYTYKAIRKINLKTYRAITHTFCRILFYINNIQFKNFKSSGTPFISIAFGGKCTIDADFIMLNDLKTNPIGRPQRCVFFIDKDASINIGKNVGISSTALVAHQNITIGDNVKIGGGVCIYDTDFHSLDPEIRKKKLSVERQARISKPVIIKDNVFIGAHTTILKGVTIGENAIIGACSVVTKNIPSNEIWAGNPAKFVKKLHMEATY